MKNNDYYLINALMLPPVFSGVVTAKELLANGKATNASQAAKMAGISRSAFYKYKDFVFKYTDGGKDTVNLSALLSDKAGVFSAFTTVLYQHGANIITVNQGMPVDGTATASLTIRTENLSVPLDRLVESLGSVSGVISVKIL